MGEVFYQMLRGDVSNRSSVLLCMGLDKGDGVLTLKDGRLNLDWPQETSMPLYQAILDCGEKFKNFVRSWLFIPLPTWNWPLRTISPFIPWAAVSSRTVPKRASSARTNGPVAKCSAIRACISRTARSYRVPSAPIRSQPSPPSRSG